MGLNNFSDFIEVLYSIRKYYTTNEYFPKHIVFTNDLFIAGT
jgi:hypothetical protein